LYLSHPLTSVQNFTEIVPGKSFVGGVQRKRGSYLYHVRVSHLLMSLLFGSVMCDRLAAHTSAFERTIIK